MIGINYVVNALKFFHNYVVLLNYVASSTTKDVDNCGTNSRAENLGGDDNWNLLGARTESIWH